MGGTPPFLRSGRLETRGTGDLPLPSSPLARGAGKACTPAYLRAPSLLGHKTSHTGPPSRPRRAQTEPDERMLNDHYMYVEKTNDSLAHSISVTLSQGALLPPPLSLLTQLSPAACSEAPAPAAARATAEGPLQRRRPEGVLVHLALLLAVHLEL